MKNFQVLVVAALTCWIGLNSCQEKIDHAEMISKIEVMEMKVDSAQAVQESLRLDEIKKGIITIKKDLKLAQDSVKIDVPLEDGILFDRYKDLTKLFKKYPVDKVQKEHEITKKQLQTFKSVLEANATKDKNGNKIDKDYVINNFNLEMKAANNYIDMIGEVEKRALKFRKGFQKQKPVIDSLMEVITTIK